MVQQDSLRLTKELHRFEVFSKPEQEFEDVRPLQCQCTKACQRHNQGVKILALALTLMLCFPGLAWAFTVFDRLPETPGTTNGLHCSVNLDIYPDADKGAIAGLEYNVITEFQEWTPFADTNRVIQDDAWASDAVRPSQFAVALDDTLAKALGAPYSQRWPWDSKKGVYIVQSGHEIHCLRSLRNAINEHHDGISETSSYAHLMHCIDLLRSSVMCHADDTLLYTGRFHNNAGAIGDKAPAGEGSTRTCRDWDKLRLWARRHSACYDASRSNFSGANDMIDSYKHCPDGAKPWTAI